MMFCSNCDNCMLSVNDGNEWQEIHVTVNTYDLEWFSQLCEKYGGKAITIQFDTKDEDIEQQSMSSIPIKATRQQALNLVNKFKQECEDHGLVVQRIKMECSVFGNDCDYDGSLGYFEGHLTIEVPEPLLMGVLQIVSFCNGAHLSKNAFKESKFMVTKRYYNTTKTEFIRDMDNLEHEFFKHVDVVKRIHEFCYHDSNVNLDSNWK